MSKSNVPMVIHGVTGSGKTSIMAGVAYHIKKRYPLSKMILIIRFIGITPSSSSIRCVLRSICEQVSTINCTQISKLIILFPLIIPLVDHRIQGGFGRYSWRLQINHKILQEVACSSNKRKFSLFVFGWS